jgi:hypothetical protein
VLALAAAAGAQAAVPLASSARAAVAPVEPAGPPLARGGSVPDDEAFARFSAILDRVGSRRAELGARYRAARGERARSAVRDRARAFVIETLVSDIFPAWMGMPSGAGPLSTASRPHQEGMFISCSYFLTAALQNAGLVLESRARFAQAPASWIQRALLPPGGQIHRYGGLPPEELERRLVAEHGDGLYVVGLDIHVGFLVIRDGHVTFVHSSYTPPGTVVEEPLRSSLAIAYSRSKGYWVSPLFRDDRLVELWLRAAPVPAPPQWPPPTGPYRDRSRR